ncbi:hypothetical protein Dform_00143 [Dehalogenimonas formicexedens]|uniref:Uncharacterized protein n=1 Tax=Dehalogenimonas formicexedens TaxID=1839801 RepID=A0A1P8F4U7_9CHLR|nr:hypothetical protein [Dehalogenimonas formicexedens]APV43506.1 hypothetical protein Dform_00143 [Dehalogenimonas formicexedens]
MKKGYVIAAAVWLGSLGAIAIGYSIFQSNNVHITWSFAQFLDPLKFFTVGLPILALLLLSGALLIIQSNQRAAKILVQVGFAILLILTLTAILSILGLLMAPAAWFAYQGLGGGEKPKPA